MIGNPKAKVILTSSSSGTGLAYFTGDARLLSLSIQSSTASASRFTISGSNEDGFQAAIPEASWSVLTTLLNRGNYTVDPGIRWIRAEQPNFSLSATSANTLILSRYYQ
jgi:hypothetical protein